jgi:hypothetical protein
MINNLIERPLRDYSHRGSVWSQAGWSDTESVVFFVAPIFLQTASYSAVFQRESIIFDNEIVWGRLCLDTIVSEVTDLSGSISKNRGAGIIPRVIRSKCNNDFILPTTDRQGVKWASENSVLIDSICEDTVVALDGPDLEISTILDYSPASCTGVSNVEDITYLETEPVASFLYLDREEAPFVAPLPELVSAPLEKIFVSLSLDTRLPVN